MQLYRLHLPLSQFPSQYRHELDQSRIVVFGNECSPATISVYTHLTAKAEALGAQAIDQLMSDL